MSTTRILTLDDIPGRSVIAQFNDIHIPYQDDRALHLAVECCEDAGVTDVFLNGDIHDCGVGSRHPSKKARDTIKWGTLGNSSKKGKWFFDWCRSKRTKWLFGNHEKWLEDKIAEDASLSEVDPMDMLALPRHGEGWEVYSSSTRLRLGGFVWEHGHGIFAKGSGGSNPAARIKATVPHQVTFIGHLHRDFGVPWTLVDERGIDRVFGAFGTGHMSRRDAHDDYAGSNPGWQQSFRLHRVYEVHNKPRLTHDSVLIHRDRRDKPVFEYGGRIYT